jgi:hypothetical protein
MLVLTKMNKKGKFPHAEWKKIPATVVSNIVLRYEFVK